jgi:hypothetical protein
MVTKRIIHDTLADAHARSRLNNFEWGIRFTSGVEDTHGMLDTFLYSLKITVSLLSVVVEIDLWCLPRIL